MIPAWTMSLILDRLNGTLPGRKTLPRGLGNAEFKTIAGFEEAKIARREGCEERVIALLFANPDNELVKKELLGRNLSVYHYWSGDSIDFFMPGYGLSWDDDYAEDKVVVTKVDSEDWFFSSRHYVDFIKDLKKKGQIAYRGDVELVLISARWPAPDAPPVIQYAPRIHLNLTALTSDKLVTSASGLITKIISMVEDNPSISILALSDRLGLEEGGNAFLDFLGIIPGSAGAIKAFKRLKSYAAVMR